MREEAEAHHSGPWAGSSAGCTTKLGRGRDAPARTRCSVEQRALTHAGMGSRWTIPAGYAAPIWGLGSPTPLRDRRHQSLWRGARTTHSEPVGRPRSWSPERPLGPSARAQGECRPTATSELAGTARVSPPLAVGGRPARGAGQGPQPRVGGPGEGRFGVGRPDPGAAEGRGLGAWRAGRRRGGGRSRSRRRQCPEPGSGTAVAAAESG